MTDYCLAEAAVRGILVCQSSRFMRDAILARHTLYEFLDQQSRR
jgi:hypothetical protein